MANDVIKYADVEYSQEFFNQLHLLQSGNIHTDITLNIEDFCIKCHKVVLCAASPYFKTIFSSVNKFDALKLTGIDQATLTNVVQYIYTSIINISTENVRLLLEAAKCLHLKGLQKHCGVFIAKKQMESLAANKTSSPVNVSGPDNQQQVTSVKVMAVKEPISSPPLNKSDDSIEKSKTVDESKSGVRDTKSRRKTQVIKYQCKSCTVSFDNKEEFTSHSTDCVLSKPKRGRKKRAKSEGRRYVTCPICHKHVSNSLKIHMRSHTGEKPYICDFCGKSFAQSCNLKGHQRVHTGERPYECKECNRKFALLKNMKDHMKVHTGVKDFMCEVCSKTFAHALSLKIHRMCHNGEKPHECEQCSTAFRTAANLREHIRRSHTDVRPYKCSVCSKAFPWLGDVRKHMKCHTGERNFRCEFCGNCFMREDHLTRHITTHKNVHMIQDKATISASGQPAYNMSAPSDRDGSTVVKTEAISSDSEMVLSDMIVPQISTVASIINMPTGSLMTAGSGQENPTLVSPSVSAAEQTYGEGEFGGDPHVSQIW